MFLPQNSQFRCLKVKPCNEGEDAVSEGTNISHPDKYSSIYNFAAFWAWKDIELGVRCLCDDVCICTSVYLCVFG